MKKFLLFLLICAMLLTLIACNNETPPATDGAGDTAGNEQGGTENGGEGDVLDAKKLLSLSPDVGTKAASLTYTVKYYEGDVTFTRVFKGDDFKEERDGALYAYIDGQYYQKNADATFRMEMERASVSAYYGEALPLIPDLTLLKEEALTGVPVDESGPLYSFTVSLSEPFLHEDIEHDPKDDAVSTKLTVYLNKSYRLKRIECEHTFLKYSGDTYTIRADIVASALADEVSLTASTAMQAYPKRLKEDAATIIGALPHPGTGDYRISVTTSSEAQNRTPVAQRYEVVASGDNYFYHSSITPYAEDTYFEYYYANGTVYQSYYNQSGNLKRARFPMTKEDFEEALGLGAPPPEGDDFTDLIAEGFSNTLKDVPVYELTGGGVKFSYSAPSLKVLSGLEVDGKLSDETKVEASYDKAADKLTVTLTFSTEHTQTVTKFGKQYTSVYTVYHTREAVFEGFESNVSLTLPNASDYPLLSN